MKPATLPGLVLTVCLAGCGLKTPLDLPEKSGDVVIRGPQSSTSPATTPAEPGPTTETPAAPGPTGATTPPKDAPKPSKLERLPPPPLPTGNAGTSRGG